MNAYRDMATLVRAMAHPVRLQVVEALSQENEACVCHLENRLGMRQAYLSQHLARMRLGGVVKAHREGLNVYYSLADESVVELFHAAAHAAERLTAARGRRRGAHTAKRVPGGPCPCPKCEARQEIRSVQGVAAPNGV